MDKRKFWIIARKYATFAILCLIVAAMFFLTDRFFTANNLSNVGRQVSMNAILSVGMTMVIISGGIDLSVGAIVAMSGVVCAEIISKTGQVVLAILAALLIGILVGFINGILIAKTQIAPFIITLSSCSICSGIVGQGSLAIIPIPFLVMLFIFILAAFLMNRTKFGRYVYAIGGNEKASIVAGIQVIKIKTMVYVLCGFLAALAGVIYTSRLSSGTPSLGEGYEMDAITAAVIGGASLSGGSGGIWGTLIGAIIIGVIKNALNLLQVNSYYQDIVTGAVVLAAVLFDRFIQTRVNEES